MDKFNIESPMVMSKAIKKGAKKTFTLVALVATAILFLMELLMLFYALNIAWNCSKPGAERAVHFILAVTFTLPYMLLNVTFNKCGMKVLRTNSTILPNSAPVIEQ